MGETADIKNIYSIQPYNIEDFYNKAISLPPTYIKNKIQFHDKVNYSKENPYTYTR